MHRGSELIKENLGMELSDKALMDENVVQGAHGQIVGVPVAALQKYKFVEKLGTGSQGQVWLAERLEDGKKVAIKQLNIHSVKTWKQYELFNREAEILSKLDIEGVVPFYEYIEDLSHVSPYVCIVQQYIEGRTLADYLSSKYRFETETIYDIILQVLQILQALHSHHPPVVHRDIKPSNLMLTPLEDGKFRVTLLDFGAVANPQVQNGGSTVAGTYGYMPPEQLMGQAGPASDIYALGALGVQLFSGVSPADIEVCDFKLVIEPYLMHLPSEVVRTLSMMLEPAVSNRISDISVLIAQFNDLAHQRKSSFLNFFRSSKLKLEDVQYICQPGNYEIWQDLSPEKNAIQCTNFERMMVQELNKQGELQQTTMKESIKDVKSSIENLILSSILQQTTMKESKEDVKSSIENLILSSIENLILLILGVAVIIGIIMVARGTYWKDAGVDVNHLGNMVVITVVLSFISLGAWAVWSYRRKPVLTRFQKDKINQCVLLSISSDVVAPIKDLLRHGTKVVGKIVYIDYISPDVNCIKSESVYHNRHRQYICDAEPVFYVRYQFQVPYFDHLLTFCGELRTFSVPENHFKVGDPITLVARMEPKGEGADLSVMPYPYPFAQVCNLQDILFRVHFKDNALLDASEIASLPTWIFEASGNLEQLFGKDKQNYLRFASCMNWREGIFEFSRLLKLNMSLVYARLAVYLGHLDAKLRIGDCYLEVAQKLEAEFREDVILTCADYTWNILKASFEFKQCLKIYTEAACHGVATAIVKLAALNIVGRDLEYWDLFRARLCQSKHGISMKQKQAVISLMNEEKLRVYATENEWKAEHWELKIRELQDLDLS